MSFQLKYSFKYVKRKYLETELENVKLYNNTPEKYQVSTEAIHQNLQIFFIIFVLLETGLIYLITRDFFYCYFQKQGFTL